MSSITLPAHHLDRLRQDAARLGMTQRMALEVAVEIWCRNAELQEEMDPAPPPRKRKAKTKASKPSTPKAKLDRYHRTVEIGNTP